MNHLFSQQKIRLVFWCNALLFCLPILLYAVGLRWNVSGSLPLGFYWQTHAPITRGTFVHFCLPQGLAEFGYQRGYIGTGVCPWWYQELLKPVVAVAGDTIEIDALGIAVNGHVLDDSQIFAADSLGRSHLFLITPGRHIVPEGYVFLLSTYNPRSWDSRYFGDIPMSAIQGTARPLWVWK